jgi:hypothetical protein
VPSGNNPACGSADLLRPFAAHFLFHAFFFMNSTRTHSRPLFFACFLFLALLTASAAERLRTIVETDAGGDPDDEQSLVRFLLYCNEWDLEGIIANRPKARDGENKNSERTGLTIVRRMVNAYGECHPNLIQHDSRYPTKEFLLGRVVPGYGDVNDGVELIIKAVDSGDPRPIWFMNWGTDHGSGPSCLKRALDRILKERGEKGYALFKRRIHLSSSDQFGDHTFKIQPPFPFWVDTFRPPLDGKRWYHQFSAITAKAGGFDLNREVLTGHGPLGALYPTNTTHWQKEGDTMTFLYLVPTGMNDPRQPGWGSWAGRYGPMDDAAGKPYYWANQRDAWNATTNRDNTLLRWAAHLQNDFRARLDWCVKTREEANHKPSAILDGNHSGDLVIRKVMPNSVVQFRAQGSSDPDGDPISYKWEVYREAGTYHDTISISHPDSDEASVEIPGAAAGKSIHVILTVTDSGTPPLAAYRRAIVEVEEQ